VRKNWVPSLAALLTRAPEQKRLPKPESSIPTLRIGSAHLAASSQAALMLHAPESPKSSGRKP
jgi:hypothetical protein